MYSIIEVDGFLHEKKKEVATWDDAIKWCNKHSYRGMSFMYAIKNEDTDEIVGHFKMGV